VTHRASVTLDGLTSAVTSPAAGYRGVASRDLVGEVASLAPAKACPPTIPRIGKGFSDGRGWT